MKIIKLHEANCKNNTVIFKNSKLTEKLSDFESTIFDAESKEHKNFEYVADKLTHNSVRGIIYTVSDELLDYKNGTNWTTIKENEKGTAILLPETWEKIALAKSNSELDKIYEEIVNDKWFKDKPLKDVSNVTTQDILKFIRDTFVVSSKPAYGPCYIMPNGDFIHIQESTAGLQDGDYPFHGQVENALFEYGLSNETGSHTADGSPTLRKLNFVRCNTRSQIECYIELPEKITNSQIYAIEEFLDFAYLNRGYKYVQVTAQYSGKSTNSQSDFGVFQIYRFNEIDIEDIVKCIKKYYSTGVLQSEFRTSLFASYNRKGHKKVMENKNCINKRTYKSTCNNFNEGYALNIQSASRNANIKDESVKKLFDASVELILNFDYNNKGLSKKQEGFLYDFGDALIEFAESKSDNPINEEWYHFEYTSGSNPYIAKDEKERDRLLKKYKNKTLKLDDTHFVIDDYESSNDFV